MPCLLDVACGKLTLSLRMPVVQRWCGEMPEVCVPEKFNTTMGPVPIDPVTTAQSPEPFDWHQLSKICVPVGLKSPVAGSFAVVSTRGFEPSFTLVPVRTRARRSARGVWRDSARLVVVKRPFAQV